MELSPIPGIRALGPVTALRDECEVQPPFALDPSGRMEDDAYDGARKETQRGLEEEDSEVADVDSAPETPSAPINVESRVNFFA